MGAPLAGVKVLELAVAVAGPAAAAVLADWGADVRSRGATTCFRGRS